MSVRTAIAKATSATLTWGLKHIARRPAGNLPGKVALKIDPCLVAELRGKLHDGSIVVVGTNGKTTVTNLIADVFEQAGHSVLCNRTGANLKSGIATALLQGKPSDWGVIECDELWLAKVAPDLQPTYIVLLDLFRDQLDRCGELDRIQDAIISALGSSPATTLIFNADDPLCAFVAEHCDNPKISFGIAESMGLDQNCVADATMCQNCLHMFEYEYRQYGQLGAFKCPHCGFARPALDFAAKDVRLAADGLSCKIVDERTEATEVDIDMNLAGSYMVYNVLAVSAAALTGGCPPKAIQEAVAAFDPKNGRLQEYAIDGRRVLLNLAKNPTGFNQNLRIVEADHQPRGVAFFINDQVVDGHDISWIWDIDFEEIAGQPDVRVFAGGSRKNDLQVRLKYAGVEATLIDSIDDVFEAMAAMTAVGEVPAAAPVYAIANYSAMPPVHKHLDALAKTTPSGDGPNVSPLDKSPAAATAGDSTARSTHSSSAPAPASVASAAPIPTSAPTSAPLTASVPTPDTPIVIAHVLPELLNLYGDGGNIRILEQRLNWRGIPVEIRRIDQDESIDLADVDLVFLGGGPDREQRLATEQLAASRDTFVDYIADSGPVLAICGGYQILGRTWLFGDEEIPGLSILGMETRRPGTSADRLIGNVALDSPIAETPVIGFENHAGRTYLDEGVEPFGYVVSKVGSGNNDAPGERAADGVLQGRVLGTYFHGTLLSKNPEVADWVLANALARHKERTGEDVPELQPLDDSIELAANRFMAGKLL